MSTTLHPCLYSDSEGGHTAYIRIPGETLHVTPRHASAAGAKHALKVWIADNLGGLRCQYREVSESQFRAHTSEPAPEAA